MSDRWRPPVGLIPLLLALAAVLCSAGPAQAHSYADPALATVFDGVQPEPLPRSVVVTVVPSVVDELAVSNPTTTPLEVLATGGEPFLRVDASGVQANLASPDWYLTSNPEGGSVPPPDVLRDKGRGTPRWARVSSVPAWAEFDPRLHPPAGVTPAQRRAGKDLVVATWHIPLRYGGRLFAATGHVTFTPVRGGFTAAVTSAPAGVQATAVQGQLPGILLRAPAHRVVVVEGARGEPFLRFADGAVEANTASLSWIADQRARGRDVPPAVGVHWLRVATGPTFTWLDSRLRYPADLPPAAVLASRTATVVQHWTVPLLLDGTPAALRGTVTWVPRALATAELRGVPRPHRSAPLPLLLGALAGVGALAAGALFVVRRRRANA